MFIGEAHILALSFMNKLTLSRVKRNLDKVDIPSILTYTKTSVGRQHSCISAPVDKLACTEARAEVSSAPF